MVPEGWVEARVGDLLNGLESGISVNGEDREIKAGEKAVLKVSSVSYGKFNPIAAKVIIGDELKRARISPKKGQIIISRSNTESFVGASAFIIQDYPQLFLSDKLWQTKPKPGTDMKWLSYVLASDHARFSLSKLATGTSGSMKNITKGELLSLGILTPPLIEQNKIAQILSTWDKAITTTEQLLANSQLQKKALAQQLLTGKKRLCGFSDDFKRYHFGELLDIDSKSLNSRTPKNLEFNYISLSDVEPATVSSNLKRYQYKDAPSRARRVVKENDILLSTVRPNLKGFAKVEAQHDEYVASTGFAVLTPRDGTCGDYIFHYLFSAHISGQINALVVGTNYPAINSSDVAGLCVYCPPYQEQVLIADILTKCDKTINTLKSKINALKQEKKALMQQLLTGKRRVKVDEEAAA